MAIFGKPSEEESFVAAETNVTGRQRRRTIKSAPKKVSSRARLEEKQARPSPSIQTSCDQHLL